MKEASPPQQHRTNEEWLAYQACLQRSQANALAQYGQMQNLGNTLGSLGGIMGGLSGLVGRSAMYAPKKPGRPSIEYRWSTRVLRIQNKLWTRRWLRVQGWLWAFGLLWGGIVAVAITIALIGFTMRLVVGV